MRNLWLIALIWFGGFQLAFGQDRRVIAGKDADGWVAILRDPARPFHERDQALRVIGEFGAEAKAAVPFLIELFIKAGCQHYTGMGSFGFDPSVKKALVQIGLPSVPALIEILNGPDSSMRVCAAEALGEIGPVARDAVPRLIQAVERPEDSMNGATLSRHAIRTLGKIGPDAKGAVPILMGELGEDGVDIGVVVALDQIGSSPAAMLVDFFVRDAENLTREGDSDIAGALIYLGTKARAEASRIHALLGDKRPAIRYEAAAILVHIDPSAPAALPVLIEALNHEPDDEVIRSSSVVATLTGLGPTAKAAMPGLIAWARKSPEREDMLRALVTIDPDNPACVPLLIEALKRKDDSIVYHATDCLSLLGPRARDALPALVEVIRTRAGKRTTDGNFVWSTIESAIRAVGRIDPRSPLVISALIEVIEKATALGKTSLPASDQVVIYDNDPTEAAAKVLGSIGPAAKAAVPALIDRLRKPTESDSGLDEVVWTLGKIGPEASAAVPILREMVGGKFKNSPSELLALHRIEPDNKEWLDRLEILLARPPRYGSNTVYFLESKSKVRILGALGRSSVESDQRVRETLKSMEVSFPETGDPRDEGPPEILESWIETLGSYGAAGREAIPRLNAYRVHRDPWVRLWATEALRQITPIAATKQ